METMNWDALIATLPSAHLLQTWEWGQVKARYGWTPLYALWGAGGEFRLESDVNRLFPLPFSTVAAALILKKTVLRRAFAARLSLLYIPKGPLLDWNDEPLRRRVLDDLQSLARRQGAIFLKADPDVLLGTGIPQGEEETLDSGGQAVRSDLMRRGWLFSRDQVQFRNSVWVDLSPAEEEILARMKQKTRYNIRLAARKGVSVRIGSVADLPLLYKMYAETSLRDGFVIREQGYYQTVWQTFLSNLGEKGPSAQAERPCALPLIAEVEGETVAAIFLFLFAGRAYYLYGMSRQAHREKMPNHLLQWEAMKLAKAAGCQVYDLWGAPDEFAESDRMWGVFRFKEGFGGQVVRTLGAWDYVPVRLWYRLYAEVMPRLLEVMRARGRQRTRQVLAE
jgi:lipid II:glycine glycyltransferase (peptidoglycan interpeptide bridge formation enzyme)